MSTRRLNMSLNCCAAKKFLVFWLLSCTVARATAKDAEAKVSCRDEKGRAVDWYYLYKLPKNYQSNNIQRDDNNEDHDENSGLQYLQITSLSYDRWSLSSRRIDAADSTPAQTLQPLFDDASVLLLAYNDEFPNGTSFLNNGHTKGVVATDGQSGLWLVHSVPKFPALPRYAYPPTGARYGQSFLCVTLKDAAELQKVGDQLLYNEPYIYYARVPKTLETRFPSLEDAMAAKWHSEAPFKHVVDLVSHQGTVFKSFAKSSRLEQDLYEDWLAPTLDVNLLVEGWRNGAGNMESNCTRSDKVYNIAHLEDSDLKISFQTTQDHSKWAVSQATGVKLWRWRIGGADWICVGDINRQAHQLERGGGTLCQRNSKVTKLYRDLISRYDPCGAKL